MTAIPVSLLRAESYEPDALRASLEALLAPLGGMGAIVKPGDRVLLKPNLLTGARPTKECVTRPEVVACVAQMVREAGGEPFLGDSPPFGSARGVAEANGYKPLLESLNLPVVEFHGKLSMIDHWLGRVIDVVDRHQAWDTTAFIPWYPLWSIVRPTTSARSGHAPAWRPR